MDHRQTLALLAALAVVPPLLYLLWVRAHERHRREPVHAVLALFLYGGTAGIAMALVLNVLFEVGLDLPSGAEPSFLAVVVAAPFIEELSKGLGLGLVRRRVRELEDGLVYGSAVGLGFAATENFVYAVAAWAQDGLDMAILTAGARVFSSMLLHAGSSALLGFGYALMLRRGGVVLELLPFYLVAVALHAGYNFLVFTQGWLGFVAALLVVAVVAGWVRRKIRRLDALPHAAS